MGPLHFISNEADGAFAVAYQHHANVLDKDTFTPGALHSQWTDAGDDEIMSLTPGGDLFILGDLEINGDLNHDGSNVGFYGTAPVAQSAAYAPTNVSTDRAYDADSTSIAELGDVLGTVIADLQATGLFG